MSTPALPAASNPRILVFDSGVGGLSVAREIQQRLPWLPLVYASDNGFFPYGTKGEAELIARVDLVIHKLLAHYPADILVVACNTASTLTLPHLRRHLSLPIVGVVPAIKPAAQHTRTGVIGLLATPATVARPYTHELIREHASQCKVLTLGSSELVEIAEQKLRGAPLDAQHIKAIAQRLLQQEGAKQMDKLVLACTHFPLLKAELAPLLPAGIDMIDSGEAIARRVEHLCQQLQLSPPPSPAEHTAVFTQHSLHTQQLAAALRAFGIHQTHYITP